MSRSEQRVLISPTLHLSSNHTEVPTSRSEYCVLIPPTLRLTSLDPASMHYMDIPIEPVRPPHIEVDPSLRTITRGVGHRDALDVAVPEVRATTKANLDSFERNDVTHVVIRQVQSSTPARQLEPATAVKSKCELR